MADTYRHRPLNSTRSIRLLRLQPSSANEHIHLTLLEVCLDDKLSYEALSYAWDSQVDSCNVVCEGKRLVITANCEAALRQLRHSRKPRTLWIDSICIDQSSIPERNNQVQLMLEIYAGAQTVLIWLGKATPDSDAALGHISRLNTRLEISKFFLPASLKARLVLKTAKAIQRANQIKFGKDAWGGHSIVLDVLQRSWFQRTWTIQESTVACRAVILCGRHIISWKAFQVTLFELGRSGFRTYHLLGAYSLSFMDLSILFQRVRKDQFKVRSRAGDDRLLLALSSIRQRKSTDPKDKVFSLHGIFKEMGIELPDPDYSKTVAEIYQGAARAIILAWGSLRLLYLATGIQDLENLPSWAPDLSCDSNRVPLLVKSSYLMQYHASLDSLPRFYFSDCHSKLFLTGKVVDRVVLCEDGVPPSPDVGGPSILAGYNSVRTLQLWTKLAMSLESYPTGEEPLSVLYKTLFDVGAIDKTEHPLLSFSCFMEWFYLLSGDAKCCSRVMTLELWNRTVELMKRTWVSSGELGPLFDWFTTTAEFMTIMHFQQHLRMPEFHESVAARASQRKLVITQGGYLGKGPPAVQVGDVVAIVAGLELPMYLRPAGLGYSLIGPGYLHGIMNGEGWPEDSAVLETLTLV